MSKSNDSTNSRAQTLLLNLGQFNAKLCPAALNIAKIGYQEFYTRLFAAIMSFLHSYFP